YLSSAGANWSRLQKPIYRSAKGKSFNDWASTWTSYMITKVQQPKASRIFGACSQLRDASACYENAIQEEPNAIGHQKGLLKCLFGLGQVTNALMYADGVMGQR
ncbi:predicted protein, partial [Nematostella vectensis]